MLQILIKIYRLMGVEMQPNVSYPFNITHVRTDRIYVGIPYHIPFTIIIFK
jgi:hypothetical protein